MKSKKGVCKICGSKMKLFYSKMFDDRYGYPGLFDIYRCVGCGFGQIAPFLDEDKLDDLYTKYYPRRNQTIEGVKREATFQPGFTFRLKSFLNGTTNIAHLRVKSKTKVLDVGCGTGASLIELQRLNCTAMGIEVDKNVHTFAKKLGLTIIGGIEDLSKNEQFDYITASQVLEHIPDPHKFISQLLLHLKPGGRIILSTPNLNSLGRILWRRKWLNWHVPYHQNFFTKKSLQKFFFAHNLKIKYIRTVTPNLWTQLQILTLLSNPSPGRQSPLWKIDKQVPAIKRKIYFPLLSFLTLTLNFFLIFLNLLIDLVGLGESFILEVEKS